eukprot:1176829-Prorocentrum_minimum.AAC.7
MSHPANNRITSLCCFTGHKKVFTCHTRRIAGSRRFVVLQGADGDRPRGPWGPAAAFFPTKSPKSLAEHFVLIRGFDCTRCRVMHGKRTLGLHGKADVRGRCAVNLAIMT